MAYDDSLMAPEPVSPGQARDVLVIGSGFVGLCSALWLQRLGHRVTIVDRDPPLPGSSYRHACSYGNACTIATYAVTPVALPGIVWRVPGMLANPFGPLAIIWRYMPHLAPWLRGFVSCSSPREVERIATVLERLLGHAEAAFAPLHAEAGTAQMLRRGGSLYLYKSEQEYREEEDYIALHRRHGVRFDVVDKAAIRDLEPNVAPLYHRGLYFRDAHHLSSPRDVAFAFAQSFLKRGGTFLKGEVRGLTPTSAGLLAEFGHMSHPAQTVVVAAGAWSSALAGIMGDDILLDTERGYHVLFPEAGDLISRPVCFAEQGFYMVPMADGLRAAGTVELGGLALPMREARTEAIRAGVARFIPKAGRATDEWMGFRPSMPDSLPVIGPSPADPRVIYAFGHGHLGVTLAAVTGRLVADLVSQRQPFLDLAPLRPIRFSRWGKPLDQR
ncbi:NAD(P)/FAD-dependent oxidoreductase [Rhodoligotrophos defluvii]|uniref:NAD(P)/FAD-dependent oxidoreductase n=1 Tax=Rhodoligotrophos defluvii TaxID=2561934 RepID=UPI001EF00D8C|nr:FAD-binding oxidoreductase [Rhodoligotrophos defluvii]